MKIDTLKVVNLLEVLYELQGIECKELGIKNPDRGQHLKLPDGRDGIFQRLWDEVRQDQWGNQQFTNDSFYRVSFEDGDDGIYTDDLSDDMKVLLEHCRPALNGDDYPFILFDVCW